MTTVVHFRKVVAYIPNKSGYFGDLCVCGACMYLCVYKCTCIMYTSVVYACAQMCAHVSCVSLFSTCRYSCMHTECVHVCVWVYVCVCVCSWLTGKVFLIHSPLCPEVESLRLNTGLTDMASVVRQLTRRILCFCCRSMPSCLHMIYIDAGF